MFRSRNQINMKDISGHDIKGVEEFKYLGRFTASTHNDVIAICAKQVVKRPRNE